MRAEGDAVAEASQVHIPYLIAGKIELGYAEVAEGGVGAVAALGDEEARVGVVEGEGLLDGGVVEGFVAEEVVGGFGEVETGGRGELGEGEWEGKGKEEGEGVHFAGLGRRGGGRG